MTNPTNIKCTSVLRRARLPDRPIVVEQPAFEGDICAFRIYGESTFATVEAITGRAMEILPGEDFLATPGFRESTRWVVGRVPKGGLVPGGPYWILSGSGIIGELEGTSSREKVHLARATYLGTLSSEGVKLTIKNFALPISEGVKNITVPVFLVVGTSSEVGKTTAATRIIQILKSHGVSSIIALKATGTSSITEINKYRDYGAAECFDCLDFGLPSTYPGDRTDASEFFSVMISHVFSAGAEAVVIECGGDIFGANVPVFFDVLLRAGITPRVVLAAADTSAAIGAVAELSARGIVPAMITGPCTDTPTIRECTKSRLGIIALNLAFGSVDSETDIEELAIM